jgi:AraC-like DNA-binding protein
MTKNLPLIRLSAINPFLLELERRKVKPQPLLESLELPTAVPASNDLFVASTTVYELVERSAELAEDRFLGFTIGNALDLQSWDPISEAANRAATVGELLTMFIVNAADHSSASRFYLRAEAERTTFGLKRVVEPSFRPGQNDAFYMGFMSRLLRGAAIGRWDGSQVLYRVADPKCIPKTDHAYRIVQGGKSGVEITFPSDWLFEQFKKNQLVSAANANAFDDMPRSIVQSVRTALQPHIHQDKLTAERAARICGFDRRRLSRELRAQGTTLSKEIAKLRADKASQSLADTNIRIADIAQTVGFTDPTVFSRAFKNWTGQSPQEYRRTHRSPG